MSRESAASLDLDGLVDVVLPCYNAAPWIDEFMKGLLLHESVNWRIIARDDGSTDTTLTLLKGWQERLGVRMVLLDPDAPLNLGLIGNYNAVLAATTARWVLSADPDDVWLPERLPLTLEALRRTEALCGVHAPIAICTDAMVVDEQLNLVADSFWRWSKTRPAAVPRLTHMAMDSVALGSTMAVNRALLERALPLPAGAAYQDWWLALVAVAFGQFVALPAATIKYRRHGENATKDPLSVTLGMRIGQLAKAPKAIRARLDYLLRQAGLQASEFIQRYADALEESDRVALGRLSVLTKASGFTKRLWVIRHGLWFNSIVKNIGLLIFV